MVARRDTDGRCVGGRRRHGAALWLVTRPCRLQSSARRSRRPGSTALSLQGADRDVAITPDGSRLVYRGNNQLLVRALDNSNRRC